MNLGIIIGGLTGLVGPLWQYNRDPEGMVTFYGSWLHSWGVYYLVVLVLCLFAWANGSLKTETVEVIAAATAAHILTAWVFTTFALPVIDGVASFLNVGSLIKNAIVNSPGMGEGKN